MKPYALTMLAMALLLTVSRAEAVPLQEKTVATIEGTSISAESFRVHLGRYSGGTLSLEQRLDMLNRFLRPELIRAAARKESYADRPEVRSAVANLIARMYLEEKLLPRLQAITVSDEEIISHYESHGADYTSAPAIRGSIIMISIHPKASEQKRAELHKRAEQAREEAVGMGSEAPNLGEVAVKYSDEQGSRYIGGDTGWISLGVQASRWPEEVIQALGKIQAVGEVGPIVELPEALYIVRLSDRREPVLKPLKSVRDRIYGELIELKRVAIEDEFYNSLMKTMEVTVDEKVLQEIESSGTGRSEAKHPAPMPR